MKKYIASQKGMTLVEILATITILSILVVSFLAIFVQSARSNNISEEVLDATYVAQAEMEKVYNYSSIVSDFNDAKIKITDLNYHNSENNQYKKAIGGFNIELVLKAVDESDELAQIVIKVYSNNRLEAQVETIVSLGS